MSRRRVLLRVPAILLLVLLTLALAGFAADRSSAWSLLTFGPPHRLRGGRWFVDPSLHDLGLGWNIRSRVRGEVPVPARGM